MNNRPPRAADAFDILFLSCYRLLCAAVFRAQTVVGQTYFFVEGTQTVDLFAGKHTLDTPRAAENRQCDQFLHRHTEAQQLAARWYRCQYQISTAELFLGEE